MGGLFLFTATFSTELQCQVAINKRRWVKPSRMPNLKAACESTTLTILWATFSGMAQHSRRWL